MQYYFEPLEIPGHPIPERFQNQFEYLFFFLEPNLKLASQKTYSPEYQQFMREKFNLKISTVDYNQGTDNYWFFKDQKPLLDKVKIFEMIKPLNLWDHDIYIANNPNEIKTGKYLYKAPFGFSGRGIHREKNKIQFPVLVEEELDRIKDFSFYKVNGNFVFYQNLIGKHLNYQGSHYNQATGQNFDSWFEEHQVRAKEILLFNARLKQLDGLLRAEGFHNYNVDCFLYQQSGDIKIHFACDINLRKTMGYLLSEISLKYFSNEPEISFVLSKTRPQSQDNSLGPLKGQEFYITYNFENDWL